MSVFCFSLISSAVRCWTMFSRLSAYFSSFCSMLSIMSNFLQCTSPKLLLTAKSHREVYVRISLFSLYIVSTEQCSYIVKCSTYSRPPAKEPGRKDNKDCVINNTYAKCQCAFNKIQLLRWKMKLCEVDITLALASRMGEKIRLTSHGV